MLRVSAGLLMYRIQNSKLQVLLAHPGGFTPGHSRVTAIRVQ